MKSLLICPVGEDLTHVAGAAPAVLTPLMGRTPLEYWLCELALGGSTEITIMAEELPAFRALAEQGARWGVKTTFLPYPDNREAAEDFRQTATKIAPGTRWSHVMLLEHLPGMPSLRLFDSYKAWFTAAIAWMPRAKTPDRVGVREVRPGVWICREARVSPRAELSPPCWIGRNVLVGPRAVIGPRAILEDGCHIEADAEVSFSQVGPATLVGRYSGVRRSLAFGNRLINWDLGSETTVTENFLLCALKDDALPSDSRSWWHKLIGT